MPDSLRANETTPRRMRTAILFAGLFAASVGGACFIESAQPSTFRFECSASDQCQSGDVCADGLCQQPCGDQMEACTNGMVCLNGFCSSVCPLDQGVCPSPQECLSLSIPMEGGSGSGGEDGGEDEGGTEDGEPESGICTIPCDDEQRPCEDGQACVFGFCADECMTVADCGSSEQCLPISADTMICIPSSSGGGAP